MVKNVLGYGPDVVPCIIAYMIGDRFARRSVSRATIFTAVVVICMLTACNQPKPQNPLTSLPYTDDFSNPSSGWETLNDINADVKYSDGALRITVKNENLTQWSVAGKRFRDAAFEVDTQPVGGPKDNGYGVLFRVMDRKNFYHFEISSDGYWRAGIMQDGKWTNWSDWIQHPAIKAGDDTNYLKIINRIKIVMQGDKLTYYVNDVQVLTREDKLFTEGDIGVFSLTGIGATGTDVSFDNVRVTEVSAK